MQEKAKTLDQPKKLWHNTRQQKYYKAIESNYCPIIILSNIS